MQDNLKMVINTVKECGHRQIQNTKETFEQEKEMVKVFTVMRTEEFMMENGKMVYRMETES